MRHPLWRWRLRRANQERADFIFVIPDDVDPHEALAWLQNAQVQNFLAWIDNMRRWERIVKRGTVANALGVAVNAVFVLFQIGPWLMNLAVIPFLYILHSHSVGQFVGRRDNLLTVLEETPHAEVWWYDAWTLNRKEHP